MVIRVSSIRPYDIQFRRVISFMLLLEYKITIVYIRRTCLPQISPQIFAFDTVFYITRGFFSWFILFLAYSKYVSDDAVFKMNSSGFVIFLVYFYVFFVFFVVTEKGWFLCLVITLWFGTTRHVCMRMRIHEWRGCQTTRKFVTITNMCFMYYTITVINKLKQNEHFVQELHPIAASWVIRNAWGV